MEKQPVDVTSELDRLRAQHHEADLRLRELDRHLSLSPEEQLEVARLKKHKLHLKDEIRVLQSQVPA
jgi:hypothetical protein